MMLAVRTATVTFALVWIWLFPLAVPAAASCAMPARESAYRFTGTVINTDDSGGTATVRTDDGQEVTVVGREGSGVISSVDLTYQRGVRYEFHPLNAQSPYRDNACTATRQIGAAPAQERPVGGEGAVSSVDAARSPIRWLGLGALLIPVLVGAVMASRWALRATHSAGQ